MKTNKIGSQKTVLATYNNKVYKNTSIIVPCNVWHDNLINQFGDGICLSK